MVCDITPNRIPMTVGFTHTIASTIYEPIQAGGATSGGMSGRICMCPAVCGQIRNQALDKIAMYAHTNSVEMILSLFCVALRRSVDNKSANFSKEQARTTNYTGPQKRSISMKVTLTLSYCSPKLH